MMARKINMELGRDFFIYGLSFLLLLEWLLPLPEISDTGFMPMIFFITVLFFIVTFLQLPIWLSLLIKAFIIGYGICIVFWDGAFFSLEWLFAFLMEIERNIELMFNGQWYALTDIFRSFLFFVLLAIMSYLLYYWTIQVRRIMLFLFFTIVYVAVIDTFTVYDATYAMIRTFVIGFLLLGLVTIYRRIESENSKARARFMPIRLATLLIMMIVTGGVFGFLSPKFEPQWADPVPFMKAAIGMNDGGNAIGDRKIGYGDNDEHLGGGFLDDDTPVFYAAATKDHYWRGETKDFYTGKGWEATTPFVEGQEPFTTNAGDVYEAEIVFADGVARFSHLFYPGRLLTEDKIMDISLAVDFYSSKARTLLDTSPVNLSHYYYEYTLPKYNVETLRESGENDPDYVQNYYTQLPEVPDRVHELAAELVEDFENRYDKVKAVEAYLTSSKFKYETKNVPVPEEEEDYVDQFLFESQRGYCDNFSTAMIVLLRTQNIPARWAKGFTQGEVIEALDEKRHIYQVTNSNAHSWVEVYFPNAGWIPFEPTRGFDQAYDVIEHTINRTNLEENKAEEEKDDELAAEEEKEDAFNGGSFFSNRMKGNSMWLLVVVLVSVLIFVMLRSKKAAYYFTLKRFQNRQDEAAFIPAYEQLLWLLNYIGYGRKNGETLREYATRIDEHFSGEEMGRLTNEYEQILYGSKPFHTSWAKHKQNWEQILYKIKS